ncbi:MAG TPA: two-component regulator propeller domain-containing protein [Pyrinomonadaceae bacterium]|nr:two-component regulator propeller domain-containing protein [Pyrinomonadaceae bacterium]
MLVLGCLIPAVLVLVSIIRAETLPFTPYTMADGLAHDRVGQIARDSVGFLWFCTNEGLSRFDGYEFKNYTQADGLPHRAVEDFLETSGGELWVATGDGVVLFNPRGRSNRAVDDGGENTSPMFRVFQPARHQNGHPVEFYDLVEDRNGTVWAASSNGVFTLIKNGDWELRQFETLAAVENKNVNFHRVLVDREGAIWAGGEAGIYRITADQRSIETVHPKMRLGSIISDQQGHVWVGSVGGTDEEIGLHVYSIAGGTARKIRTYRKRDGLHEEIWLNALLETSGGRILVGIGNALCEFVPDAEPGAPNFRLLSTDGVVALGEDIAGNVWIATNSSGVRRLARGGFVNFSQSDNLGAKRITSIISSSDGHIYVLAELDKIHRFDGKGFTVVEPLGIQPQSWGRGAVTFRDKTGAWWIASNLGLQRYPPVEKLEDLAHTPPIKTYTMKDGVFSNVIFHLLEDTRGDIWIGSIGHPTESLSRWERSTDTIHQYTAERDGLPVGNPVTAFAEDRGGNIWIGYYGGGLVRYNRQNGRFDSFSAADNLPPGYIANIFADSAGRVWVATSHGGAVRIDEPTAERPRLTNVTTKDGLSSDQTTCTTEDNFGRIYISTGRGVNRLYIPTGQVKVFTKADGLPDNIVTQCGREKGGALWFGTWNGAARHEPAPDDQTLPPPVFLSDIRVNGVSVKTVSQLGETNLDELEFTSDQRQVQVDFFALAFGVGESLRYQYKLDGMDADWSEPSSLRLVSLNLSSGSYTFLVRAINAEGVASGTPARLSFSIARPLWQRWWFLLGMAIVLAVTGYLIYRYRLAQLLKLERVRTRIASDLHDDIGSSLSQIAILSEVARHKAGENGAAEPLRKIADTSRDLVDSMSDIVWAINPQKDHLSDLVQRMRRFAEEILDAKDIGYQFSVSNGVKDVVLGADVRRETYLIFKECMNNLVKHSSATEALIKVDVEDHQLRVMISDNGRGFDVESALTGGMNGFGGNGLPNMRRRANSLGGAFAIESKKSGGTEVNLCLPISK